MGWVMIQYPKKGRPVLSVQADHAQLPASTVKLLTTVFIIPHELGAETLLAWHTRMLALSVNDGVVQVSRTSAMQVLHQWLYANSMQS